MAVDDFDPTDLDTLIQLLKDAGIHATEDERFIRTPGVYIRHDSLPQTGKPLAGALVRLSLFLVVEKATERTKSRNDLAALWNQVRPVLQRVGRRGDVNVRAGLTLPDSRVTLPAYLVPLDIVTQGETS